MWYVNFCAYTIAMFMEPDNHDRHSLPNHRQFRPLCMCLQGCLTPSCSLQAVIGAGAAGLVSIRELRRAGHSVTAFEQSNEIGGVWVYSEDTDSDDPLGVKPSPPPRPRGQLCDWQSLPNY